MAFACVPDGQETLKRNGLPRLPILVNARKSDLSRMGFLQN